MENDNESQGRKYLGMKFECCGAYARVYYNKRLNAYTGHCPRCLKPVKIKVDKEKATTQSRFFRVR